ncbi:class II 3-deoxy-7-phosphoheptulonate synthase [Amycolatopsis roodepoortensis]|uniref:Phospho-2-dehydro-3-deoxyheptonate aldolase n=1 Tax=Amycolatopsis roodepoortensis TaxID=700274 RepID=A0ABR9L323_9PSEU|nr:3-deoxy-7-phosphoheptulonate synthase class II [Amycolatopsis roodepoortensis]MBE1574752.1 3-deoxy-7-phosphoheptulonate synthase [Amycolatopsis roodepoortensis]
MTNSEVLVPWRDAPAAHQPEWPDRAALREVLARLSAAPGLVTPRACDDLRHRLAEVASGRAFALQGGDCAETFDGATPRAIQDKTKTLLQMAVVLTHAAAMPIVKIGRMAGQYAKPRSSSTETRDGLALPVYRGDAVNGYPFDAAARRPDPARLWRMYEASRATLDIVDGYARNGYASLDQLHRWNRDFVANSPSGARYEEVAYEIDRALRFMRACGAQPEELRSAEIFASHEGLLLDYEDTLTRTDHSTGRDYATSGHMLWIGERTRALDGAHVAYFRSIANPIGVKLGPTTTPAEVRSYVDILDPDREPGRLTFITRMGARQIRDRLPALIRAAQAVGGVSVWICDPMHGNTFTASSGHKTRLFADVVDEVRGFFEVHRALGTHPGGVHVEFTGEDVTECVGGSNEVLVDHLHHRYESTCDPRLNRSQSLDLAFDIAELL